MVFEVVILAPSKRSFCTFEKSRNLRDTRKTFKSISYDGIAI